MNGYLFVFFTGEHDNGEQIYFAVSRDGLHWQDLNEGKPVLLSTIGEKGVRDPFLVRDPHKGTFYLFATDLRIGANKGWEAAQYEGSRNIIVWESFDLIQWSEARSCSVGVEDAGCVWAPEGIYDTAKEAFFIFWASMIKLEGEKSAKQRIYGAYTKDFRKFSRPFIYMEASNHVIDMNIVEDKGWYYRFVKDESCKRITMDRVKNLLDSSTESIRVPVLEELFGVEGPEAYQLPDGKWCLIVDQFGTGKGYLPLVCNELAMGDFTIEKPMDYDLGKLKKRHGCVIPISEDELKRLNKKYNNISCRV